MADPTSANPYSALYQAFHQQFGEPPLAGQALREISDSKAVTQTVANSTFEKQKKEEAEVVQQADLHSHNRGVWRLLPINANTILSCSYDGTAKIWNINNLEENSNRPIVLKGKGSHNKRHEILSAVLLTNETVITGSANGVMNFWNPSNGQNKGFINEPKEKSTGFYSLALLGDTTIASGACQKPSKNTGYWSHDIKLWDVENLANLQGKRPYSILKGHQGGISAIVSLDQKRLASSSGDKTVRLWNIDQTEAVSILKGHTDYVYTVANLGNNMLGSGGKDFTVRLWNIEKEQECGQLVMPQGLEAHSSTVYDVAPFQDHMVLTASRDAFIKMWDLRTNKLVKVFDTGDSFAYSVAGVGDDTVAAGTCENSDKRGKEGGNIVIWKLKM